MKKKNTPTKECFLVFSQENMTLLHRSAIIKNKSFIYKYIYIHKSYLNGGNGEKYISLLFLHTSYPGGRY